MVDLSDIENAYRRIEGIANKTPVMTSRTLDALVNASALLKCRNFQRAGSFKFRGAYNTFSQLTQEEKTRGVITHSSGNHASALALAAKLLDIPYTVVMPSNASKVKVEATGPRRIGVVGYKKGRFLGSANVTGVELKSQATRGAIDAAFSQAKDYSEHCEESVVCFSPFVYI